MNHATELIEKPIYGLDPIYVTTHDVRPGAGRMTIACWDRAWTSSWNAMNNSEGPCGVADFIKRCDVGYLVDKFISGMNGRLLSRQVKHEEAYLEKIIRAVQTHYYLKEPA